MGNKIRTTLTNMRFGHIMNPISEVGQVFDKGSAFA